MDETSISGSPNLSIARRGPKGGRPLVSDALALPAQALVRAATDLGRTTLLLNVPAVDDAQVQPAALILALALDRDAGRGLAELRHGAFAWPGGDVPANITRLRLSAHRNGFGSRWLWSCPVTTFASRQAHGLAYASQRATNWVELHRRLARRRGYWPPRGEWWPVDDPRWNVDASGSI